jgi:hypothetical protein
VSNIISPDKFKQLEEQQAKLAIERNLLLQKALTSSNIDDIYKAQQYLRTQTNQPQVAPLIDTHKSMVLDPFEIASSFGYYQKQTQLSYEVLRGMQKVPLINAIIQTRKDQVTSFCVPQPDKYSPGFIIKKRGQESSKDLSDQEKREVDGLIKFILDCAEDEDVFDLDDFDALIRKIIGDSLTLDQACFEVVFNRAGIPVQFLAVDGGTMRIADSYDNENNIKQGDKPINGYYPSYVQIYQNRIINEYYPWELCFGIRNPNSALTSNGYGTSELEILINTVTSMLNTDAYNSKFFQNGTAPKGALMVKNQGGLNRDKISELRREWTALMSGVSNSHKTPILDAEKVEWVDLYKSNREMEFSKYQEYLIKVACAVFKISPEEIGFPLQGTQGNGLGSKEGGEEEKTFSKEKGLKPLLKSIQTWINKFVVYPKTQGKYEFQFVGMSSETSKGEEDRLTKAATIYMTPNEIRETKGMKPVKYGDMILNPIVAQQAQMDHQVAMSAVQDDQQGNDNVRKGFLTEEETPFDKAMKEFWVRELVTT